MRIVLALLILLATTGCTVTTSREIVPDVYSRAEIDVLLLRTLCLNNARTLVQAARCSVR